MTFTVGQVAKAAGVTVRTLHHYDELGLVVPERSESGYRVYDAASLEMLQQVVYFRELGFPLDAVARIVADPQFDRLEALERQLAMVRAESERMQRLARSIENAIDAEERGRPMGLDDMFDHTRYAAEAEERWGDTEPYKESQRRYRNYSKEDVARAQTEMDTIADRLGELKRSGAAAESEEARALVEEHRLHIDSWWYPCSKAMHAQLGEMYVQDPRFAEYWDSREPGLAAYVNEAIAANLG